jgi:hypothetical protein
MNSFDYTLFEELGARFTRQKSEGLEIMGAIEEIYLGQISYLFRGAAIHNFVCGSPCFFGYIRACLKEDCSTKFAKKANGVIFQKNTSAIFMSENVYINYCRKHGHSIGKYKVEEVE